MKVAHRSRHRAWSLSCASGVCLAHRREVELGRFQEQVFEVQVLEVVVVVGFVAVDDVSLAEIEVEALHRTGVISASGRELALEGLFWRRGPRQTVVDTVFFLKCYKPKLGL